MGAYSYQRGCRFKEYKYLTDEPNLMKLGRMLADMYI